MLAESAANEQARFSAASDSVRSVATAETSTPLSNPAVACAHAVAAAALDLNVASTGPVSSMLPDTLCAVRGGAAVLNDGDAVPEPCTGIATSFMVWMLTFPSRSARPVFKPERN